MGRPRKDHAYYHAPSGLWRARYKQAQFYGKTEAEAVAKKQEYIRALEAGLRAAAMDKTVREYSHAWLPIARVGVTERTFNSYAGLLDKMNDICGDMLIKDVRPSDIKTVYSVKFREVSQSQISKAKNLYVSMFDYAVSDGLCSSNPARDITAKPHKGSSGTHRSITEEERRLIETVDHPLRPVVMLMLYAGLRNSEALAVNIDRDIDFDSGMIHVQSFRHVQTNRAVVTSSGKSKAAVREIPLFDELRAVLEGRHGLAAATEFTMAVDETGRLRKVRLEEPVVMSSTGWDEAWDSYKNAVEGVMNDCPQKRWYGKRKKDAGVVLPPWKEFTVRPYDLRHSFCTWCRDHGVDMHVLQKWMGHSDISMIARVYDHVSEERIKNEVEKLKRKT